MRICQRQLIPLNWIANCLSFLMCDKIAVKISMSYSCPGQMMVTEKLVLLSKTWQDVSMVSRQTNSSEANRSSREVGKNPISSLQRLISWIWLEVLESQSNMIGPVWSVWISHKISYNWYTKFVKWQNDHLLWYWFKKRFFVWRIISR